MQSKHDARHDDTCASDVVDKLDLRERLLVVFINKAKARRRTPTHIGSDTKRQKWERIILNYRVLKSNNQDLKVKAHGKCCLGLDVDERCVG